MIDFVSITDLKQNTASVIKKVKDDGKPIMIIQRSEPAAILIDPDEYETLIEALEDLEDLRTIEKRKDEPTVPFEKVAKKLLKSRKI